MGHGLPYVQQSSRYRVRPQIGRNDSQPQFYERAILFSMVVVTALTVALTMSALAANFSSRICDALSTASGTELPQTCHGPGKTGL